MPITPHFVLSQTVTDVIVDIRVPHVRVSVQSVEVVLDGSVLHFSSPPYLLVLTFPAPFVEESDGDCATYDPSRDGGTITLRLRKQEPALWPDLDMMGALVTPRQTRSRSNRPGNISVVSSTVNQDVNEDEDSNIAATESSSLPGLRNALKPHYGFLNQHVAVFTDLAREGLAAEMLELPYPDETDASERRAMRLETEQGKFDADRYMGDLDLEGDYIYEAAISMVPHWVLEEKRGNTVESLTSQMTRLTTTDDKDENAECKPVSTSYFTPDEMAQLASIPYPLLPTNITLEQEKSLFMGLLDLLFAYVYDHLLTEGEPTTESSWTVCTLSCTLSWLEEYNAQTDTFQDVMSYSIRRALIYPYLRNYQLALHCWKQVGCILENGRRCVIRSLLQIRSVLDKSECHYLGNRLYIDPYLAWLQRSVTDENLSAATSDFKIIMEDIKLGKCLEKEAVNLNLVCLEQMAKEAQYEQEQSSRDSDTESEGGYSSSSEESDTDLISVSVDSKQTPISASLPCSSDETDNDLQNSIKVERHSSEFLDSELVASDTENTKAVLAVCGTREEFLAPQNSDVSEGGEAMTGAMKQKPLIEEM